ncbi:chorismate-binding protein [Streptomyces lavendulae]|uniref:chorismate-binding protein n=1 Tax=Streptomyces lavendulae TaxID=1914 RepID=UPI0031F1082A
MPDRYHESRVPPCADPMAAALWLTALPDGQEGHVLYEKAGCWSYAAGVLAEITVERGRAGWNRPAGGERDQAGHPFTQVDRLLRRAPLRGWRAYGWIGYEVDERRGSWPTGTTMHLMIPSVEIRLSADESVIRTTTKSDMRRLKAVLESAGSHPGTWPTTPYPERRPGDATYLKGVTRVQGIIAATPLRKAVISRRIPLEVPVDLRATYAAARPHNTPARSFLCELGRVGLVGFSPETVLEVQGGDIRTTVLAGTALADADAAVRDRQGRALRLDPKEVYEHAVTVAESLTEMDAISEPGTAGVATFMDVVRRGNIQHLSSTLTARLRSDLTGWEALRGVYPASAVTGVPREAAREAIRALETTPRGMYGGAVFTYDHTGDMDVALALRCVIVENGEARLQAGAGITASSVPERELAETEAKLYGIGSFLVASDPPSKGSP